jgi:hypothetical protein
MFMRSDGTRPDELLDTSPIRGFLIDGGNA